MQAFPLFQTTQSLQLPALSPTLHHPSPIAYVLFNTVLEPLLGPKALFFNPSRLPSLSPPTLVIVFFLTFPFSPPAFTNIGGPGLIRLQSLPPPSSIFLSDEIELCRYQSGTAGRKRVSVCVCVSGGEGMICLPKGDDTKNLNVIEPPVMICVPVLQAERKGV